MSKKVKDEQESKSLGKYSSAANSFVPLSDEPAPPIVPDITVPTVDSSKILAKANETITQSKLPTFEEYKKNKSEREKAEAAAAADKPKTLSDYLEEQRKSLTKDKTDAVKMQKYYALTDVFNALGKMGGAAAGGAIGGNMLDSAPNVGEYKESRGYLDAFENAKKANERLRALDAQEFQLAYETQKRNDDRAYDAKVREAERAYKTESERLNREWTAEQNRINREWQKAVADQDFERQSALKKELATMEQNFKLQYQKINNAHEEAIKKIGQETVKLQNKLYDREHPIVFRDGNTINMTTSQIEDMLENFKGQVIGGRKITEDNFGEILRSNPDAFKTYFELIGVSPLAAQSKSTSSTANTGASVQGSNVPLWWNRYVPKPANLVESSPRIEGVDDDLAQFEVTI